MSESLTIEGKEYISVRRAAEIAAYSKDYVGQLCRSGKLACRMVGRFWYVDEDSLRKYQVESFKANQTSFRSTNSVTSPVANFIPNLVPKPMVTSGSVSTISGHSFILPVYKQIFFVVAVMIAVLAGGTAAISISKPFLSRLTK